MENYVGKILGSRYRVLELIGVGGMATVYRAYDSIDDRTVAIKILKDEFLANEEFRRRFKNESKAIAVLSHPNIVKVYDVNFGDRLQYIVMEYVEGITLKEYIETKKQIDWREAVHFVSQILRALQHAHDKGIVHRDVKPQNIMLLQNGTIKVTDFGIARFCRGDTRTLAAEGPIGSVHYISPEQARGDITDDKADIYSVGVVLYEMLTGTVPFKSDSAVSVAIMQVQEEAKKPTEINPNIPKGLEQITLHAMQKNPQERYQSAAEMLLDIDEFKRNPQIRFDYSYFVDNEPTKHIPVTGLPQADNTYSGGYNDSEDDIGSEEFDEEVKNKTVPVLTGIMIALACVVVIGGLIAAFKTNLFGLKKVEVPYFINMTYEEVIAKYPNWKFEKSLEYSTTYEEGIVFAQRPAPHEKVKANTVIILSVATRGETIQIPVLEGDQFPVAETKLRQLGFNVQGIEQYEPDMEEGIVLKTNPEAGQYAAYGEVIFVYYSTKVNTNVIYAPNTVGNTLSVAKRQLEAVKLKVGKITYAPSSVALKDFVLSQNPPASSPMQPNMVVDLVVGSGVPESSNVDITVTLPKLASGSTGNVQVFIGNTLANSYKSVLMDGGSYSINLSGKGSNNTFKIYVDDLLLCEGKVDFTKEPAEISNRKDYKILLMQNVENIQYEKAVEKLVSAGFAKANITAEYAFNEKVPIGYVYAQSPKDIKGYPADQKITLYVSRGPEPTTAPPVTTTQPPVTTEPPAPPQTTESATQPANATTVKTTE